MKKLLLLFSIVIYSCNPIPTGDLSGVLNDNSTEVQITKELMEKYVEGNFSEIADVISDDSDADTEEMEKAIQEYRAELKRVMRPVRIMRGIGVIGVILFIWAYFIAYLRFIEEGFSARRPGHTSSDVISEIIEKKYGRREHKDGKKSEKCPKCGTKIDPGENMCSKCLYYFIR